MSGGKAPPNPCSSRRKWVWVHPSSGGPWPLAAAPGPVFACPCPYAEKGDVVAFAARRTFPLLKKSQREHSFAHLI